MMITTHTSALHSPKLSAAMNTLSVKRPSLSPLKRKRSEDETTSPTSTDELVVDSPTESPTKKMKQLVNSKCLELQELARDDGSDALCGKVLEKYTPVAFDATPSAPLDDEELAILNYFLS